MTLVRIFGIIFHAERVTKEKALKLPHGRLFPDMLCVKYKAEFEFGVCVFVERVKAENNANKILLHHTTFVILRAMKMADFTDFKV